LSLSISYLQKVFLIEIANETCEKENKKTIAGEHVLTALKQLGFEEYVDSSRELFQEVMTTQKQEKEKKSKKVDVDDMEMIRMQEEMFRKARERFQSAS
jgi:histone H3/H4